MPTIEITPRGQQGFDVWTVCLGADGREQPDPEAAPGPGGRQLLSAAIEQRIGAERAAGNPYTDVIVMTHGWLSTESGAETTFTGWAETAARELSTRLPPDRLFRPLVVGLFWPSAPTPTPARLLGRRTGRAVPFETVHRDHGERPTFLDFVSHVLPWASFYTMKARAQRVGRRGGAKVISGLQAAAGEGTAFHLLGHSFGCKLLSEALANGRHPVRPVRTLFLVQGAFSAWGFSSANAYDGAAGSVAGIIRDTDVTGVLLATSSRFDYALGRMFPGAELVDLVVTLLRHPGRWRGGLGRLTERDQVPRLAALGHAGPAGVPGVVTVPLQDAGGAPPTRLGLQAGRRYHLGCDAVLTTGTGPDPAHPDGPPRAFDEALVGAHSNLLHPELAAAFWEAVFAAPRIVTPSPQYVSFRIPSVFRVSLTSTDRHGAGGSRTHEEGTTMAYPDGTLLRASDQPQVWLIQGGERHWIPNPQVFNDDGFSWAAILVVGDAQVNGIPQGPDVPDYTTWLSPGPSDPALPGQQLPVVEYGGVDYRRWRSQGGGHTIYVRGGFVTQTGSITGTTITTNSVMFAGFHSATYAVVTDGNGTIVWTSPASRIGINPQGFSGQTVVVPSTWNFEVPMDVADRAAGFALIVTDSPDNLQQILAHSVGGLINQAIQAIGAIGGVTGGSKKSGAGQATAKVKAVEHVTASAAVQRRGWTDIPAAPRENMGEPAHAMA